MGTSSNSMGHFLANHLKVTKAQITQDHSGPLGARGSWDNLLHFCTKLQKIEIFEAAESATSQHCNC